MGTCGLVGQIGTAMAMGEAGDSAMLIAANIGLLQIVLPAVVTYVIYLLCYKAGWIADGDMALDL